MQVIKAKHFSVSVPNEYPVELVEEIRKYLNENEDSIMEQVEKEVNRKISVSFSCRG